MRLRSRALYILAAMDVLYLGSSWLSEVALFREGEDASIHASVWRDASSC